MVVCTVSPVDAGNVVMTVARLYTSAIDEHDVHVWVDTVSNSKLHGSMLHDSMCSPCCSMLSPD